MTNVEPNESTVFTLLALLVLVLLAATFACFHVARRRLSTRHDLSGPFLLGLGMLLIMLASIAAVELIQLLQLL